MRDSYFTARLRPELFSWLLLPWLLFPNACPCQAEAPETFISLVETARTGDLPKLSQALAEPPDLEFKDAQGLTALAHALDANQFESAKALLNAGAKPNGHDDYAKTWLGYAASSSDARLVSLLLNHGADPNYAYKEGKRSPLVDALYFDNPEAWQALIEAGINPDFSRVNGRRSTPLAMACQLRAHRCVQFLLERGADPNQPDANGYYPLVDAAWGRDLATFQRLLEAGASPNVVSPPGSGPELFFPLTPLAAAALFQAEPVVELLLRHGANPQFQDEIAVKLADLTGNRAIHERLVLAGASAELDYGFRQGLTVSHLPKKAPAEFSALLQLAPDPQATPVESSTDLPKQTWAVIATDPAQDEASALLSAQLSKQPGMSLVEREQIQALLREQSLQSFSDAPSRLGRLLGAEFLLLLDSIPSDEDTTIPTARLIDTRTSAVPAALVGSSSWSQSQWATSVANAALQARIQLNNQPTPKLALSLTPLLAQTATSQAQSLEQQLTRTLAVLLARQPAVLMLDRQELNQLILERDALGEEADFIKSGYVIEGSFSLKQTGEIQASFHLAKASGDEKESFQVNGHLTKLTGFYDACVKAILSAADGGNEPELHTDSDEGEIFRATAFRMEKQLLFDQAIAAADTALALGVDDPELTRLLFHALTRKLIGSRKKLLGSPNKKRHNYESVVELFSPLSLVDGSAGGMDAEELLDAAHRIIALTRNELTQSRQSGHRANGNLLYYRAAIESAIVPLQVLNSLSERQQYGDALNQLKNSLAKLHDDIREFALESEDMPLLLAVQAAFMQSADTWLEESIFFEETTRIVSESHPYPHTLQVTRDVLLEIASKESANPLNPAAQRWARLGRKWTSSSEPALQIMGHALQAGPANHRQQLTAHAAILQIIPQALKLETTGPGMGPKISSTSWDSFGKSNQLIYGNWPDQAMMAPVKYFYTRDHRTGWYKDRWTPVSGLTSRALPERLRYREALAYHELQRFAEGKLGPLPDSNFMANFRVEKGATPEKLKQLLAIAESAETVVKKEHPEIDTGRLLYHIQKKLHESISQGASDETSSSAAPLVASGFRTPSLYLSPNTAQKWRDLRPMDFTATAFMDGNLAWLVHPLSGLTCIDETGEIVETVSFPEGSGVALTDDEQGIANAAAMNDRYFVGVHSSPIRYGFKSLSELLIYDRLNEQWSTHPLRSVPTEESDGSSPKLLLFGDQLIYGAIINATVDAGEKIQGMVFKHPDSIRLLVQVDLPTGKEKILANSRRTPAQSPLDKPAKMYFIPNPISDHALICNDQIYDLKTETWKKAKRRDTSQAFYNRRNERSLQLRDLFWSEGMGEENNTRLRLRGKKPGERRLYSREINLPFTIEMDLDFERLQSWPNLQRRASFWKPGKYHTVILLPTGLILSNQFSYCFIPVSQLAPSMNAAKITD